MKRDVAILDANGPTTFLQKTDRDGAAEMINAQVISDVLNDVTTTTTTQVSVFNLHYYPERGDLPGVVAVKTFVRFELAYTIQYRQATTNNTTNKDKLATV